MEKNGDNKARKILSKIDPRFTLVGPIEKNSDKPVFLVKDQQSGEKAVLKCSESDSKLFKRSMKFLFGTSAARTERALYKWISCQNFLHFRTPRLLGYYKTNLLISFEKGVEDSGARDDKVSESLHEFYIKSNQFRLGGVHKIYRQARYLTSNIRALLILKSGSDKKVFLGVIKLIRQCYVEQKPLYNSFCLHNDLNPSNVLHSSQKEYPVIIDFQRVKREKRWLFNDIVRYSFRGDSQIINFNTLEKFIKGIDLNYYGDHLNIEVQIRYALLCRTLQSLLWRKTPHVINFISTILIDDEAFATWLKHNIEKIEIE